MGALDKEEYSEVINKITICGGGTKRALKKFSRRGEFLLKCDIRKIKINSGESHLITWRCDWTHINTALVIRVFEMGKVRLGLAAVEIDLKHN